MSEPDLLADETAQELETWRARYFGLADDVHQFLDRIGAPPAHEGMEVDSALWYRLGWTGCQLSLLGGGPPDTDLPEAVSPRVHEQVHELARVLTGETFNGVAVEDLLEELTDRARIVREAEDAEDASMMMDWHDKADAPSPDRQVEVFHAAGRSTRGEIKAIDGYLHFHPDEGTPVPWAQVLVARWRYVA